MRGFGFGSMVNGFNRFIGMTYIYTVQLDAVFSAAEARDHWLALFVQIHILK